MTKQNVGGIDSHNDSIHVALAHTAKSAGAAHVHVEFLEGAYWYNAGGQRLRDDWTGNSAWRDDEVDDLEGFERQQLAREAGF